MSKIVQLPKAGVEYEKNNLFNCNLDTLDKFFPPKGFPRPKEINYISLGFYITNYDEYKDKFDKDILIAADKYNNPGLYYKFMKDDLGLSKDPNYPKAPLKYMYEKYKVDLLEQYDLADHDTVLTTERINQTIERLYIYILLADKNLIFAKDQLSRMRRSVTCMDKRLKKQTPCYNLYMITDLTRYFRKTLDIYEDYISDKTGAAKFMYDDLVKSIKDCLIRMGEPVPDRLNELELFTKKEKLV